MSFIRMNTVPLGYGPQHAMSVVIPIARENAHTTWADRARFFTDLRDKIARRHRGPVLRNLQQRHSARQRLDATR